MKAWVLQSSSKVLEGCYFLPLFSIFPPLLSPMLNKWQVCTRLNPFEPFCYMPLNRGTGVVFSKSRLRFFERKNELQLNCTSFRTTGLSGIVVKKKKSRLFVCHTVIFRELRYYNSKNGVKIFGTG